MKSLRVFLRRPLLLAFVAALPLFSSGCLFAIRAGVKAIRSAHQSKSPEQPPTATVTPPPEAPAAPAPAETKKAPDNSPAPR